LDSWTRYEGVVDRRKVDFARNILFQGNEVGQMMKVVGEEGTSLDDYVMHLKSEFLDSVYLQQNAFDPVDASVGVDRQRHVFDVLLQLLVADLDFADKNEARTFFTNLRQRFLDYNGAEWQSDDFKDLEKQIQDRIEEKRTGIISSAEDLVAEESAGEA
jgi:V/A-type H+-transporting ATPase subunit A